MSFGEGDLRERVDELERERDYWRGECRDMLSEFWDTESEHCAMLDYPRPSSACAPSVLVMASRQGYDTRIEDDERRIAELERENARLQSQLDEGNQMYHRALERGRELESLVRDLWQFTGTACGKYPKLFDPVAAGGQMVQPNSLDAFEQRMIELGIETEGDA